MLLYNQNKNFIGMDEETLRKMGYNTLDELKEDVKDFADLFDKKPGLIHNFKNFSWIDFLIHSEKKDVQAHIRCNGKVHAASFKVENFFLDKEDGSTEKAYIVKLKNIEFLGEDDGSQARELHDIELPAPMNMPDLNLAASSHVQSQPTAMIDQTPLSPEPDQLEEKVMLDMDMEEDTPSLSSYAEDELPPLSNPSASTSSVQRPVMKTPVNYRYDPSVAANELGLPEDLIDEFVGDFIVQAKKFRAEIDEAVSNQDFDALQILSHKLKGVAANLRIEDALEVLTTINTSHDASELKSYVDYFFAIIDKLEFGGKEEAPMDSPFHEVPDDTFIPDQKADDEDYHDYHETMDDELYNFDLVENEQKTKEYQALSALADELSTEADELPSLIEHEKQSYEKTAPYELPVIEETPVHYEPEPETVPVTLVPPPSEEESGFDLNQTARELGMDTNDLHTYIQEFVDQANDLKSELESALKSKNFEQVRLIATELKGASEALHMSYASSLLQNMQTSNDIRSTIDSAKAFFVFVRQL